MLYPIPVHSASVNHLTTTDWLRRDDNEVIALSLGEMLHPTVVSWSPALGRARGKPCPHAGRGYKQTLLKAGAGPQIPL